MRGGERGAGEEGGGVSMMRCDGCSRLVDTDEAPDSLYVKDGQCWCESCCAREGLEPSFDDPAPRQVGFEEFMNKMVAQQAEEPPE